MSAERTYFILYALVVAYLCGHFAAYLLFFRHRGRLSTERSVFRYHFVSACLLSLAAILGVIRNPGDAAIATAIGVIFAHGIYSLSFLELWTLSQISYSREILLLAKLRGQFAKNAPPPELTRVGDSKKNDRFESLCRLKLLRHDGEVIKLTLPGRLIGNTLRAIAWLAHLKATG
jgi:hypothetical protein